MAHIIVNNVQLYYEIKGKAEGTEAVVFLNGLMSSASSWALQVPVFEKAGFKVVLHDFRGQLLSDKPIEEYTFTQHALDLKALLDQLGINKIHIVSTSYGALVGMRFALDFPAYVKSISMIGALPELDHTFRSIGQEWQALLAQGDMAKFFSVAAPSIYSKTYLDKNKGNLSERGVQLAKLPREYVESLSRLIDNTMENAHLTHELPHITCPVLLACAENDTLTPLKFSKLIQQKIPHAELVIIPDAGHSTITEKPETISSLTLGFISKQA